VDTFEHDVAAIQPSAPRVVEDYRTAHAIALDNDNGMATEPDLRLAMFHYQSPLKTLLETTAPAGWPSPSDRGPAHHARRIARCAGPAGQAPARPTGW
jgi:hypothetical protein